MGQGGHTLRSISDPVYPRISRSGHHIHNNRQLMYQAASDTWHEIDVKVTSKVNKNILSRLRTILRFSHD